MKQRLQSWLAASSPAQFGFVAALAGFLTYFSLYAFRKPFAAAHFDGSIGPLQLKIALVTAQIIGYALSKFIGIRFVSELPRDQRAIALVKIAAFAEFTLVVFAVVPDVFKPVALFFNGLVLGTVWGVVFSYFEGRRTAELLGAGLSTSYIVASGAVKTVGKWLLDAGLSESLMPAAVGLMFFPVYLLGVYVLGNLPPPSEEDQQARTPRSTMYREDRRRFFLRFAPGLATLTALHFVFTAFRDFRDNFAVEILQEAGQTDASVLTSTELWIAPTVLACLALIYRIRDNRRALLVVHFSMAFGAALILLSTLLYSAGNLGAYAWMTLVGLGLYLAYVPYGTVLFDRMIAAHRIAATSVFMIYVTDAFGYVGAISVHMFKNFGGAQMSWLEFFRNLCLFAGSAGILGFLASALYFGRQQNVGSAPPVTDSLNPT